MLTATPAKRVKVAVMFEFAWPWMFLPLPLPWLVRYLLPAGSPTLSAIRIPSLNGLSNTQQSMRAKPWDVGAVDALLVFDHRCQCTTQWLGEPLPVRSEGREIMLAVDLSGSMEIADMQLNDRSVDRLTMVKAVLGDFITRREGDRLGLIFADTAFLQTPMTYDRETVRQMLEESVLGLVGERTAIGDAIALAVKRFRSKDETNRVLVLLTDGQNTAGNLTPDQALELADAFDVRIYPIAVGAEEVVVDSFFGQRRVNPSRDLDVPLMQRIAETTGGRYFRARSTEELEQIYQLLDELEPIAGSPQQLRPRQALYFWPLSGALLLMVVIALFTIARGGFVMADFHFLRPWWLLALLPLALFYWRLLVMQKTQSGWHQWLPQHLAHVLVNSGGKQSSWSAHRLGLFWLISSTALAGPTWERLPQPVYQLETGQVVIMDMSPSLLAEDIEPNRLTQLRFKATDLVKSGLDGDTGLIAYADDAFTISPLTADNNNLLNLIPSLSPQIMPNAGSEPLRALLADELLTNAGYAEGDIYWLTDGIATSELNALSSYLRKQPHRVSILGIGTTDGAPVRSADGSLLKDRFNQPVIAKLTPSRLQDLASLTGGIYQTVRRDNDDVAALVNQPPLTREGKDADQQQQGDQWRDNGPFLALLLIPLVLFSWRRGGSLGCWLLLAGWLPLSLSSGSAYAAPQQADAAPGWWLNQEQQAQQLLEQEQYQAAAELSEQPFRQGWPIIVPGIIRPRSIALPSLIAPKVGTIVVMHWLSCNSLKPPAIPMNRH